DVVAAARVGRPAGPGPPDRPHVRTAGPARRTAVLARAAGRGRARHREIHRVLGAAHIEEFITTTMFAAGHRSLLVLKVPAAGSGVPRRSPVRPGSARQRTHVTRLADTVPGSRAIFRSRGRHPSHQHDPASVTFAVAAQILPICVIGAGCDEVGEAVQNGGYRLSKRRAWPAIEW